VIPFGVAVDGSGNVYSADSGDQEVRKLVVNDGRRPRRITSATSTLDLLHHPAVPIRIVERCEGPVVASIGVKAGRLALGAEVERLADVDVSGDKIGSRNLDVRHDKVQALDGPRPLGVSHQGDGAGRARWSELDHAEVRAATMINVDMESDPLAVERLRAIHVRNRHDDEFQLVVQDHSLLSMYDPRPHA